MLEIIMLVCTCYAFLFQVDLLRQSDKHANVVRYYSMVRFFFITGFYVYSVAPYSQAFLCSFHNAAESYVICALFCLINRSKIHHFATLLWSYVRLLCRRCVM